ncbi:uncharacterized protein [Parasteatoda tepidariorum]|uniref:uncharacterized protein n=1 Tax=Parasteatoda tepidariorum TaxID=114398 RepID=UPI0039BC4F2B
MHKADSCKCCTQPSKCCKQYQECNNNLLEADHAFCLNVPAPKLCIPLNRDVKCGYADICCSNASAPKLRAHLSESESCEDICCSNVLKDHRESKTDNSGKCEKCDHIPPPLLRFNYSTRDGEHDESSNLARYETTYNADYGRKSLMKMIHESNYAREDSPRFLEIYP